MAATVEIWYGVPGVGKSLSAVEFSRRSLARGRRVYSTFQIAGCRPLLSLAHCWCTEFAGSDFIIDEAGSMFSAREYMDLDKLSFTGLTHARHQDIGVVILAQHPAFLDKNFRRMAPYWVEISKRGPNGEHVRKLMEKRDDGTWYLPKQRRPLLRHPWLFIHRYYSSRDDYTDDCQLNPAASPRRIRRFLFRWCLADSYNSFNHVPAPGLRFAIAQLQATAAECANLGAWQRAKDGHIEPVYIPRRLYEALEFPVPPAAIKEHVQQERDAARSDHQEAAALYRDFALSQLSVLPDDVRTRTVLERYRDGLYRSAEEIMEAIGR